MTTDKLPDDIVERALAQKAAEAQASEMEIHRIGRLAEKAINTWWYGPKAEGGLERYKDPSYRNEKFWFNKSMAFDSRFHTRDRYTPIAMKDPFPIFYSTNDYDTGNLWPDDQLPPGVTIHTDKTLIWTGVLDDGTPIRINMIESYSASQW